MNNKEDQLHEISMLESLCELGLSLNNAMIIYAFANRKEDSFSEAYVQVKKMTKEKDAQKNNG